MKVGRHAKKIGFYGIEIALVFQEIDAVQMCRPVVSKHAEKDRTQDGVLTYLFVKRSDDVTYQRFGETGLGGAIFEGI